jgi:cytochrome c peroxidase
MAGTKARSNQGTVWTKKDLAAIRRLVKTGATGKSIDFTNRVAAADGPIKTFPLRGINDSPPYLHDGRLLTLDDTVEFFSSYSRNEADRDREVGPGGVSARSMNEPE